MQGSQLNLSIPMTVFTIFYAIAWGALANALPRWKAFDTGRFWDEDVARRRLVRRRFVTASLLLNVLSPCYFACWLAFFGGRPGWELTEWGGRTFFAVLVAAMAAWTPPFGLYRIWASVVQKWPQCFYPVGLPKCEWDEQFPGFSQADLSPKWAVSNFCFGILYLTCSVFLPFAFFYLAR
jgi:hypothetical protein